MGACDENIAVAAGRADWSENMEKFLPLALWSGVATALGAVVAAWLTRRTKISEFRQAWINDLRKDIADYIGASDRWMGARDELNSATHKERQNLVPGAQTLSNEARVILHRIELRLNPRENRYRQDDEIFLDSLKALLDPQAAAAKPWRELADDAVMLGRELLKREWEVTKRTFWRKNGMKMITLHPVGLMSGTVGYAVSSVHFDLSYDTSAAEAKPQMKHDAAKRPLTERAALSRP
jgi:hypothetical protein